MLVYGVLYRGDCLERVGVCHCGVHPSVWEEPLDVAPSVECRCDGREFSPEVYATFDVTQFAFSAIVTMVCCDFGVLQGDILSVWSNWNVLTLGCSGIYIMQM